MLIIKYIFILATIQNVIATINEQDIIQLKENSTFILTFGFEQYRQRIHEQNILKFSAAQDSDSLILSVYNITDYTHNPRVLITNQLQILLDLLNHNIQTMPSNITFANCTLSYSQQCVISEFSTKVKDGDTFYLTFIGVGMNHFSQGQIKPYNINIAQNELSQNVDANSDTELIFLNTTSQKNLVLKLQEKQIQKSNKSLVGQVEVYFLHPSGELLGDKRCVNKSGCNQEWEHESNQVQLKYRKENISKNVLLFQSNMQNNRQFIQQFDLQQIIEMQNGEDIELHIQQDYKQNQMIGIAIKYITFPEQNRQIQLTSPAFITFTKKSENQDIILQYFHPLFSYLFSKDKQNQSYINFSPQKNKKLAILFEIEQIDTNNSKIKLESKVYYSQESMNSNKPDEVFQGLQMFQIDINKIQNIEEQENNFQGIYFQLFLTKDEKEDNKKYVFNIKSIILLKEKLIDNDNNQNNNNNNNNNNDNNNNNNDNNVNTKTNEEQDNTIIILVVAFISFIIFSTVVYMKCFRNRSQNMGSPQQLEELGDEGDKNNDQYDIEKVHSNNEVGTAKKPQSTKSIKTNGNHIQLAQEDEKSSIDFSDNHNSSFRKTKNHTQVDLSASNLQQDRNKLIEKKPIMRLKNKKNHLRIEVEDAQYDKEREQAQIKQQQLKLMQQQALKQKQRQQNI